MNGIEAAVTWTLSRRVTVFVLAVMVIVVGVIAARRLALEFMPKGFKENDLSVVIPVDAANPVEVQESIVRPTEELLRTVPGIKRLVSSAGANEAWLHLEFSKEVDLDLATAEVRDRLERARLAWPREVRRYRIFRFNLDTDLPIFQFGIVIKEPSDELTFLIEEKIVKPLEAIPEWRASSAAGSSTTRCASSSTSSGRSRRAWTSTISPARSSPATSTSRAARSRKAACATA